MAEIFAQQHVQQRIETSRNLTLILRDLGHTSSFEVFKLGRLDLAP